MSERASSMDRALGLMSPTSWGHLPLAGDSEEAS